LVGAGESQRRVLAGAEFYEIAKTPEQFQAKLRRDLESLKAETAERPDDPRWWYYLGQTLEELGENVAAIRDATVALDQATRRFAELMMEAAVTTAIRGKTMDDADEELGDEVTAPHPMAPAEFK